MRAHRIPIVSGFITLIAVVCLHAAPAGTPVSALVEEAARNNPDILAARRAWQAATQVPSQVSTLPDPEVSVQQFSVGSPRPFAGYSNSNFAYIGFGISQELPYPGKLKLKAETAERDAGASRDRYEAIIRSVREQVKGAYFELAYARQMLVLLDRDDQLLGEVEKIAEARYRVGQGNQQNVLKAQLEQTELLRDMARYRQIAETREAQIKKLLNRAAGSPDVVTQQLTETTLHYTSDDLLATVRTNNPEVAGQQELVRRQSLQVEMARKDRYPDFKVQYMWQHTSEQYRDYYMLTFSARVPIYRRRKLDPEMSQAVEELNQSRREYESQVQNAYFAVRDQYIAAETAAQVLKIYREGLIPQALSTYRAGLAAYEAGKEDFETLLSSFRDVLNFDEEYWKALADHETALARLEQLTGTALN